MGNVKSAEASGTTMVTKKKKKNFTEKENLFADKLFNKVMSNPSFALELLACIALVAQKSGLTPQAWMVLCVQAWNRNQDLITESQGKSCDCPECKSRNAEALN